MLVGLQPNMLESFTRNQYLNERGLPQRFLFFIPEATGRCIISELPETDMKRLEAWGQKITTLAASFRDQPLNMPLTMDAQMAYKRYAQVMEDRKGIEWGNNDALESWASKLLGMTARLAGILALLNDPKATCVERSSYDMAQCIMEEYFIPHMRYAFCGAHRISETAEILLKAMKGTMTREQKCVRQSTLWDR